MAGNFSDSNFTSPDTNLTFVNVSIESDWSLSAAEWVVFIAVLVSMLLLAMLIALLARRCNQQDEDDDWSDASSSKPRRAKKESAADNVQVMAMTSSSSTAATAATATQLDVGSQSSISPIVVPSDQVRPPSSGRRVGTSLSSSSSVPAINVTTPTQHTGSYHLTADHARHASKRPAIPFDTNSQRTSSVDRAPTPIIWGDPNPRTSKPSDPVYGYSHLEAGGGPQKSHTSPSGDGEYDDVVQAQMLSHRVTTPRQSHHYDNVVS